MADVPIDCEFPVWGLMPKKETGVVSFLNKYPEYDGRNTVIAILDSGVDPAAAGLQMTSTGETKVIERFDCSGCGDIDTSTIIKKVVDGCITGLTGRKLKIPESWKNPTGEYRVGVVYPFSLYPSKVKERMQEHRRQHLWDVGHKPAAADAARRLQEFELENGSKTNLSAEEKLWKEELEARVEALTNAEKKYTDLGPTYDCVLYNDGTVWRACIDTSESGDLATGPLLGEYSKTLEHAHLTPLDELTVSVNVLDDGDTLQLVGMCSTHGTHVACIAAGYFPDEPERNGVAPGAKVVSLTIGDGRLGSMETGAALVRACIKIMELSKTMKIDVVNMSYGEHAHWAHAGRVGEVMCEVVNRFGVTWVVSAGNHGPALATVGAPPDIAQPVLIGVGAYVSPEMMSAAYSMRTRLAGGAFSWSSRGPCADGALGLSVAAPGGAVASVARFTLRNCQLMNGTSMAAPHVAGAVAALVSGLADRGLPHSPYSVKRSLENSATELPHVEPWAQGAGLLNVEKAFELLSTYHSEPERDVTFNIQCGSASAKGILLRPRPGDPPRDVSISVEPKFMQDFKDGDESDVIRKQIAFGVRLALTCGVEWVSLPQHLDMMNASRPIIVRIDTAGLPPGAHFASINAYDVRCVAKGPVFRVAVTVLQPEPAQPPALPALPRRDLLCLPAVVHRHFLMVPLEATWAVLRLRTRDTTRSGRFLLHLAQRAPRRSCRAHELQRLAHLAHDAPTALPVQLLGGVPLEVCITKYWADIGALAVEYWVEFAGLRPDFGRRLALGAADCPRALTLTALTQQELQPSASLKYTEPVYRPSESKLAPLTARDVIPPSRQIYQLINTYTFHIAKAAEVSPTFAPLCDMLYESEFESQMWMLYNCNKQLMAVGDAYPSKYSVKLEKGEYSLRLGVRHESRAALERLADLPLALRTRLPQPLPLDLYACQLQALTGGKKVSSSSLASGASAALYVAAPPADKVSRSSVTVGHSMSGSITFAKDELARRVDTWPLSLALCEPPRRPAAKDKDKGKPSDDFVDALRDFVTNWLSKLEGDKLEQVYEELLEKEPQHLGAHVAYLHAVDSHTDPAKLPHANQEPDVTAAWCEQLITISEKVIKEIDQDKLLAYLGMKNDTRSEASKIKQEQEKQRGYLVEALCRKGAALCRLRGLAAGRGDALRATHRDLLKFTDLADTKAIHYGVWHCFTHQHWGRAIKLLSKMQEERPSKEVEERLIEAYDQLGWEYLVKFTRNSLPIKYPSTYRPF